MKRMLTIALVLIMVLSLAVPAMAAEPTYSITIYPTDTGVDHVYEAYQIFTGTIDTTGTTLSNVEWGTGVNSAALLTELQKDTAWAAKVTDATTAGELADLLADKNTTTAMFEYFRTAVGACLTTTVTATADKDNKDASGNYLLDLDGTDAGAGYYLVKDQDGSLTGTVDTYTNYILRVVGKDTLHPKGGDVIVDKVIVDGGSAKEAADYSIGDTVHFRVTGTLPANYTAFTTFYYEFADVMSAGLTYTEGSVKVYLENHGQKIALNNPATGTPYFTVTSTAQTVNVVFDDLKAVAAAADRTIDASTIIIMEYDAVLNENAEIGEPGNRNDAQIIFDNNPYTDGRGETPWDYAWAFTWTLKVTKTTDLGVSLADAKFVFYRESEGAKQYIQLDESTNKVSGWTTDKDDATVIVSAKDEVMPLIGLEADTYYLEEIEAPDGYNKLEEPITVVITAVLGAPDSTGGYDVEKLYVKFGNNETADGIVETGEVSGTVVNKSGSVLPETGGRGTTLFYVLGTIMVLGAAVLLITKKRMTA